MTHVFVAILLFLQAPIQPAPAAMVLEVKGKVDLQPAKGTARALAVMDLLYLGDQLRSNAGAQAVLVFMGDSHQEQVQAKEPVSVGRSGCTPPDRVLLVKKPGPEKKLVLEGLKELSRSSWGATRITRSPTEPKPAVVTFTGTSVLMDRPSFCWPADEKAKSYLVELFTATGRLLWQATTTMPTLSYPEGKKPLTPNRLYTWHVLSDYGNERKPLAGGDFFFVSAAKASALQALEHGANSSNIPDVLLAAMTYECQGVYEEALRLYERLCELAPQESAYHAARAALYEQAGRKTEAKKAWTEAEKLGYIRPKENGKP
jgi:hypothetical protein